jgi:putative ABC transport system ATP-binding protein
MKHHDVMLENVTYGFEGQPPLIEHLTLRIPAGQYVVIVGPNGSGKSTLFSLIRGATVPTGGRVRIGPKDVSKATLKERARLIASVCQNPLKGTFPHMTVAENMAFSEKRGHMFSLKPLRLKTRRKSFQDHLSLLGIGLENRLDTLVGQLSGGQQQALSLAMATVCDAQVLLLDEPTAALDPAMAETIMQMTQSLVHQKNLTALMVTHNLDHAVRFGDRLLFWQKGRFTQDKVGEAKSSLTVESIKDLFV